MPTHKGCKNFSSREGGWCNLKSKKVDPDGSACPEFEPRSNPGADGNPGNPMSFIGEWIEFFKELKPRMPWEPPVHKMPVPPPEEEKPPEIPEEKPPAPPPTAPPPTGLTVVRVLWDPNWEGATVEERTHLRRYYRLTVRLNLGDKRVWTYDLIPSAKLSGEISVTVPRVKANQVQCISSFLLGGKLIHPWASGWDLTVYTLEKDPLRVRVDGHARKSLI